MVESTDGTSHPFSATLSAGLIGQEHFQRISFQPQYAFFSPEELRVADYTLQPSVSLTTAAQNNGHANWAMPTGLYSSMASFKQTCQLSCLVVPLKRREFP
jgi:hypothetical protein